LLVVSLSEGSTSRKTWQASVLLLSEDKALADDLFSTPSADGVINVVSLTRGNIETVNDFDWFGIALTARSTYRFDLQGSAANRGTLVDPYTSIRNAASNRIIESDNGGVGLNSRAPHMQGVTHTDITPGAPTVDNVVAAALQFALPRKDAMATRAKR
jgi:hypothetical protein